MKENKLLRFIAVIVAGVVAVGCIIAPTPRVQQVIVVPAVTDTAAVMATAPALVSPPAPTTAQAVVVVTRTPLASSAPTAKSSDTLVVGMRSEPDTLYPLLSSMFAQSIVNSALFAVCTRENEKLEWIPEMCVSVPTLENGGAKWVGAGADRHLEVTFVLKSGWNWHDGTRVTAHDYVFTWKLALDPGLEIIDREPWEKIQEVTALDDQTVVVKYHSERTLMAEAEGRGRFSAFKEDYAYLKDVTPTGPVVDLFYYALGSPLPAHLLSEIPTRDQPKSDFARRPVGNGAYKFKDWKPSGWIELEANLDFQLGAPKIKNIMFRFMPDTQTTLAAMQQNELDVVTQDGPLSVDVGSELDALEKAGYRLYLIPNYMWEHVDLNTTRSPFDDVRVRRALAYATDVQKVVNQTRSGKVIVAYSFLPPVHWAYDDIAVVKYEYNLSKARALLKEAGWDCSQSPCTRKTVDGKTQTLEFTLATTDRPYRQEIAQILQQQWSEVGFRVTPQILPGRSLFQPASQNGPLASRTFDAALYTWGLGEEPDLVGLYDCASIPSKENDFAGQNYPGWCNKTVDDKIIAASSNPDFLTNRAKLKFALADVQRVWTADVPVIPLIHNVYISAARVDLKGYMPTSSPKSPEFWNAWQWEWSK